MTVIPRNDAAVRRLSDAILEQSNHVMDFLSTLTVAGFPQPSASGSVADTVAVLFQEASTFVQTLPHGTAARPISFSALVHNAVSVSSHQQVARRLLMVESPAQMMREAEALIDEVRYALDHELPEAVATSAGPARVSDVLRLTVLRLISLCEELRLALKTPSLLTPLCVKEAARGFAMLIGDAHPGRNVELRIPPVAAVQIGDGVGTSTHRRGTPPTVVECAPEVFVQLCTGGMSWQRALDSFAVSASGAHADLAHVFPVVLS